MICRWVRVLRIFTRDIDPLSHNMEGDELNAQLAYDWADVEDDVVLMHTSLVDHHPPCQHHLSILSSTITPTCTRCCFVPIISPHRARRRLSLSSCTSLSSLSCSLSPSSSKDHQQKSSKLKTRPLWSTPILLTIFVVLFSTNLLVNCILVKEKTNDQSPLTGKS